MLTVYEQERFAFNLTLGAIYTVAFFVVLLDVFYWRP
jgi:hypothetical protein